MELHSANYLILNSTGYEELEEYIYNHIEKAHEQTGYYGGFIAQCIEKGNKGFAIRLLNSRKIIDMIDKFDTDNSKIKSLRSTYRPYLTDHFTEKEINSFYLFTSN